MSNRIDTTMQGSDLLTIYFTAGYPKLNDTREIIISLAEAGVDLIEIGLPFSDPLADGPTIQATSKQALENGMSTAKLFEQLEGIRDEVQVPLVIMGNLNPIMRYGVEEFCADCARVGVDGLILPDLPPQQYEREFKATFERYGLHHILLVTPETSEERIRYVDQLGGGFLYLVSSSSTTGAKSGFADEQVQYFERIQSMNLKTPTQVGFGISNAETFQTVCQYSRGAIIGSAYLKAIAASTALRSTTLEFVDRIRASDSAVIS